MIQVKRPLDLAQAEELGRQSGAEFLNFIEESVSYLRPFELSFAAEALGAYHHPALHFLISLLRHADPTVREGAIIGLTEGSFSGSADYISLAISALQEVAKEDCSDIIRKLAEVSLETISQPK